MNKKLSYSLIITPTIIKEIETIILLPDNIKPTIESLLLSKDNLNITLAEQMIQNITSEYKIRFFRNYDYWTINNNGNIGIGVQDPSRTLSIIPSI